MKGKTQPWLQSAAVDGVFILAPPFFALACVLLFPSSFKESAEMPVMYWLVLIVFIDVAHVYSTLYRTYFRFKSYRQQPMLISIPVICYLLGVVLYLTGELVFWRVLAYLAVFHFIRQQYGFMRLYSRQEEGGRWSAYINTIAIYIATIYPLVYWHLTPGRKFNWFVDGDFFSLKSGVLLQVSTWLYLTVIVTYLIKELYYIVKNRSFNLPRNLLVAGTFLSWYFGIVYFNGDMAFTTLNVISHGIPYMALIWIAERKRNVVTPGNGRKALRLIFSKYTGILYFVGILILFAYFEEGLWDGLVSREHSAFFEPFKFLPVIKDSNLLALLIPLLALPQSTHYVLDGFIWRKDAKGY
jgi:hypothetical protein